MSASTPQPRHNPRRRGGVGARRVRRHDERVATLLRNDGPLAGERWPRLEPHRSDAAARAAHGWFDVDHVARDPETTTWKRRARWGQVQWREARGYPIGFEPYRGGADASRVGSRLELAFARTSGANF